MKKIAFLAVCVGALGLLGCGGGSGDDDDDTTIDSGIIFTDGNNPDIDAAPIAACNPISQTGCETGEKCTWIVDQATPTLLAYTGCATDGDKNGGDACTGPDTANGETGFDDCVAGYYCIHGYCGEICDSSTNTCSEGFVCATYTDLFDDVGNAGICDPTCDPVQQDCEDTAQACYLQAITGESSCTGVPSGAATQLQDDLCYGPDASTCYLNGCAKGYGANQPDNTCAFFCNPIDNWSGNVQGLSGDPSGIPCEADFGDTRPAGPGVAFECRFIQSYYSNTQDVAASTGMCVDPEGDNGGGSCANFNLTQLISDINDGIADASDYCTATCPECCMLDCISLATQEAQLPALRSINRNCYVSKKSVREQYCNVD